MDQVNDAGDGPTNDRCNHVDPQVVVHLFGGRVEPVDRFKLLIGLGVRVSVLANGERDVSAGEGWVVADFAVEGAHGRHSCEDEVDGHDLEESVVGQPCALVLD